MSVKFYLPHTRRTGLTHSIQLVQRGGFQTVADIDLSNVGRRSFGKLASAYTSVKAGEGCMQDP